MLVLSTFALAALSQASVAYYRSYGPRSVTRLARPTVTWEVWPSEGGRVTGWDLRINNRKVRATYDSGRRELQFTPDYDLDTGDYAVSAKVTVDGSLTVSRAWSFRVSSEKIGKLAPPSEKQVLLLQEINSARSVLGLAPALLDDRLDASASAHTSYLKRNRQSGHFEQEGAPGFSGNAPADRMEAFGYFGSSYEDVCTGAFSLREGMKMLFDAPYHRIPFMAPGQPLVGGAYENGALTLQFGVSEATRVVVSPAPNQPGLPLTWDQPENPNPLRLYDVRGQIGYPVVFAAFGVEEPIRVSDASLTDGFGNSVPFYLNSPANDDHLENAAFVLPKKPLRAGTLYSVTVRATDATGRDISKSWSFTTRS